MQRVHGTWAGIAIALSLSAATAVVPVAAQTAPATTSATTTSSTTQVTTNRAPSQPEQPPQPTTTQMTRANPATTQSTPGQAAMVAQPTGPSSQPASGNVVLPPPETHGTSGVAAGTPLGVASQQPTTPEDGQWTMPGKNYANTRYSALDQIKIDNAKDLRAAFTFSTGVNKGHEAAPLVVGDMMYIVTPYPNILYGLKLLDPAKDEPQHRFYTSNPDEGGFKYEPKPEAAAQGVACCDVVNRGCFYDDGKIYFNTLDCHVCCVDAKTGKEVWKTKVGDINMGESMTMAPLVARGKVFVGNSGGEFGVRGWVKALDAKKGNVVWTAYSTGPDTDCLIGDQYKPHYDAEKGKDLGETTWPGDHWKIGGGTVWGWITYDPDLNLIYYGTSNPGSWNPELRPGDNKWACGGFARDPDTGQARWYYQYSPHDLFDHDAINEHIVLDLPINGQTRKVVVHPGRTGFMYVLDRADGEVISATPYMRLTAAFSVDLKTGRPNMNPEKEPVTGKTVRDVSPASPGAKDWQPCAYSPRTGLLYVPHQNLSCDYNAVDTSYIAGTPYVGVNEKMYAGAEDPNNRGVFEAWDLVAQRPVWKKREKFPVWSGTVVTAGDVCFYGTMDGWFKCLNAKTGEELWKFKCGSGIIGQPVTYKGPDGKQYVAILSGVGGWSGVVVSNDLDTRDASSALGFVNAMQDLPKYTTKGGMLYVFSLP